MAYKDAKKDDAHEELKRIQEACKREIDRAEDLFGSATFAFNVGREVRIVSTVDGNLRVETFASLHAAENLLEYLSIAIEAAKREPRIHKGV